MFCRPIGSRDTDNNHGARGAWAWRCPPASWPKRWALAGKKPEEPQAAA